MIKRIFAPLVLAFVLCAAVLLGVVSCATTGPREKAIKTYATVHALLTTTREVEWAVCGVVPPKYTACTNPEAVKIGLTDPKHQAFNGKLEDAFKLEQQVGVALKAWQTGMPPPTALRDLVAVATEIVGQAKLLVGESGQKILARAQEVLDAVMTIFNAFSTPLAMTPTLSTDHPTRALVEGVR